jgi:hypothetical protein
MMVASGEYEEIATRQPITLAPSGVLGFLIIDRNIGHVQVKLKCMLKLYKVRVGYKV